tara:strand:- start:106 stop:462 length:357 start_codon:yes stop_codon:yes gene_type:complete
LRSKKATTLSLTDSNARIFAERIYVLLKQGRFPSAHRVINEAEASIQDKKNAELNDTPIAQLDLSDKIINILDKAGFIRVGDLIGIGEQKLKDTVSMCGDKTIELIKSALIKEIIKRQ